MILLIIKSYLTILLSIGIGSLLIFILGLYLILRKPRFKIDKKINEKLPAPKGNKLNKSFENPKATVNLSDLTAIAGEDVMATQLDLARAYIETGRLASAKKILESVSLQGSEKQQQESQQLMNLIHAYCSRY